MASLNEIHKTLETKRRELREVNRMFRDELKHNAEYQEVVEQINTLREKKKSIENAMRNASQSDAANLDLLKLDVKSYTEMLSDVALNKYAAHEDIEIVDEENVRWLPSFTVKFKKEDGEPVKAPAKEKAAAETPLLVLNEGLT